MLSVLFATEDYYTIKEINNVEESFCRRRLSFCQRKLLFWWQKFRKTYFALVFFFCFFCWLKLPFCRHKLRKACFTSPSSCQGKKSELQGLASYIAETFVGDELTLTTTNINPSSANPTKWSYTLNQFVGNRRQIFRVFLTILWGWRLKG